MAKKQKFTASLEPFGDLLYALYDLVREMLNEKSDDELRKIILDTQQCTETNCGWTIYHMREIVAYEAKIILQRREKSTNTD